MDAVVASVFQADAAPGLPPLGASVLFDGVAQDAGTVAIGQPHAGDAVVNEAVARDPVVKPEGQLEAMSRTV